MDEDDAFLLMMTIPKDIENLRLKGCVNSPLQQQLTTKHIDLFIWTEFKSTWSTCADVRASSDKKKGLEGGWNSKRAG